MRERLRRTISGIAVAAVLLTSQAAAGAAPATPPAQPASSPAAAGAAAPATETDAQRKARLKAEKAAAKAEAKRKRAEERAANPKKKKGSGLLNCLAGGALGIGLSLLLGEKSGGNLIAAGAAGCAVGWGLGKALKGKDEEKLNGYLRSDYIERDDVGTTTWVAPESGQTIQVETVNVSYKTMQHTLTIDQDVTFDPANIRVAVRKMRATTALKLRSAPMISPATDKGSFNANEIVGVYGDTLDGKWSYISERNPDGSLVIVGYAATAYLSQSLAIPPTMPSVTLARHRPAARPSPPRAGRKGARPSPPPAARPASPPRQQVVMAPTRCKGVRVSAAGKSGSQELCGGGASGVA
jgi:hypothetical protein